MYLTSFRVSVCVRELEGKAEAEIEKERLDGCIGCHMHWIFNRCCCCCVDRREKTSMQLGRS